MFLIFRIVVRIYTFHRLHADDILVIAAWLMILAFTIIFQLKIDIIYWQYDVLNGRKLPTTEFADAYSTVLPQVVTWIILYYCCLWSVKFSFLIFFRQLNSKVNVHRIRIWWWVVTGLTFAALIASIGSFDYQCTLGDYAYIMTSCFSKDHVDFQNRTLYANATSDVVTDLLILSIPILILWNVKISWQKKLALFSVFSVTVLIMIVAIIRVAILKPDPDIVQTVGLDWLYLWSVVEMGVAVIVACIGSFRQLFVSSRNQHPPTESMSSGARQSLLSYLKLPIHFSSSRKPNENQQDWSHKASGRPSGSSGSLTMSDDPMYVPMGAVHVRKTFNVMSQPASQHQDDKNFRLQHEFV